MRSANSLRRLCARLLAALILCMLNATAAMAAEPLRLATTHTLEDSGLLKVLVPAFERSSGSKVRVIIAGTGQVLKLAQLGEADVVVSHSRADEEKFVAAGHGIARRDVMYNDFVIAGMPTDPAHVRGLRDAAEALRRIAAGRAKFVSRGDDSGTHKKELALWQAAGTKPAWGGYVSAGLGMGRVLLMAGELQAYTLVDRATYVALHGKSGLEILVAGDPRLLNEYAVIVVSRARHPKTNVEAAQSFARWIEGSAGREIISGFRVAGAQVFFPAAGAR
jgi:tungstate transport system substrate-binding protein